MIVDRSPVPTHLRKIITSYTEQDIRVDHPQKNMHTELMDQTIELILIGRGAQIVTLNYIYNKNYHFT